MSNFNFKDCLERFKNAQDDLKEGKSKFVFDVQNFMRKRDIPVKVLFFGDTFGLDIDININNLKEVPRKIPLDVLSAFCEEFGCEFEYTNCDGERYIFSFGGLSMLYC